ncbi:hypothetical protein [Haloplanus halobius]|uniref:hypothetical protein n=1 Tax=Haloplanus halobius TaxID=2934938 RepID=UPI00200DA943|nr:hypothetical protein [Haloplanus sp. XH21]
MPASPDDDILTDRSDDSFFTWYHHALAIGYTVSAAVSMSSSSLPLTQLVLYTAASLCGVYLVVAVLTVIWRRVVPGLLA